MPGGRLKSSRKNQNWGTVESKHKEKLLLFEEKRKDVPSKKKDLIQLQKQLQDPDLEEIPRRELEEQIQDLEKEIYAIENNVDEFKYMLDAGPLLFQYFDNLNNPNVSFSKTVPPGQRRNLLKKKKSATTPSFSERRIEKKNTVSRFELLDEYNSITDPNWVKKSKSKDTQEESVCPNCHVLMRLNYRESVYVCPECAIEMTTFIDSDRPSYKDPPPEVNYFAYKRINHFNELLAQFQAKESTHIPNEVFETIKEELRKERKTVKDLNYELVKRYLKKHTDKKYNHYYDHIFHIINRLNGVKPRNMTPEMEEKLRYLFLQIQEPFNKYCPEERKNFISYNFVFYKFCELLGYKEFLQYFPLLKSKDKLYEQEKIWEKICLDIGLA